tara:strand:+ start:8324 stop:9073 length:750 start_codon:yes stop_codon:yes gene_type:complete
MKIQKEKGKNVQEPKKYKCSFCDKKFYEKSNFTKHELVCTEKSNKEITKLLIEIENLKHTIVEKDNNINNMEKEVQALKEENKMIEIKTQNSVLERFNDPIKIHQSQKYIEELQNKLHEIAIASIEQKNEIITNMVQKYVKKQPRKKFNSCNVVYILTTNLLQKERRYIIGKAKNLTNRLSTYNKTDEHEVVFYQECEQEDTMDILEKIVLKKLDKYKERANRERFILPNDKSINDFIEVIKNSLKYLE